jgi:AcrR family transcriptional regulator
VTCSDDQSSVSRGKRTRARILAATAELIAEQGWGGVSTRDIAARAGVTQGVVTYHARSKDELLRTAALAATEEMLSGPTTALLGAEPLADGLLALGPIIAAIRDEPGQTLLLFETMLRAGRDPDLRDALAAMLREFRKSLTNALRREQAAGRLRTELDPSTLAAALAAALDGLFLHAIVDTSVDPEDAVQALADGLGVAEAR